MVDRRQVFPGHHEHDGQARSAASPSGTFILRVRVSSVVLHVSTDNKCTLPQITRSSSERWSQASPIRKRSCDLASTEAQALGRRQLRVAPCSANPLVNASGMRATILVSALLRCVDALAGRPCFPLHRASWHARPPRSYKRNSCRRHSGLSCDEPPAPGPSTGARLCAHSRVVRHSHAGPALKRGFAVGLAFSSGCGACA